MTDWSEGELADARRDVAALLRATIDGRQADVEAILDSAGERGARCVAQTLLGASRDLLVRLTVALSLIEDQHMRDRVGTGHYAAFLAEPDIRAAIEANLARMHADVVAEG